MRPRRPDAPATDAAPLGPARVQLGYERLRAGVDARAHADLLQERHEPLVLHRVVVGEHLAHVARVGQPLALRHPQEQSRQPVGEVAADQQQVVVLELVEELLRRQVLGLQCADELEHVLVRYDISRRSRQPAEHVIHHRALKLAAFGRQVGDTVRRVSDDLGARLAAVALQVDGALEQGVEGRGDEEVEVGDLRELTQRLWRLELYLPHDRAQPRVCLLAPAALPEVAAHDVVEAQRLRQGGRIDLQASGQFLREPFVEGTQATIGLHAQQVGSDDRDDPALVDVIEEVVPGVFVEVLLRWEHGAHAAPPSIGESTIGPPFSRFLYSGAVSVTRMMWSPLRRGGDLRCS